MKTKTLSIVCAAALPVAAIAAVPIRWTVETSRLSPATFEVVRGETLALEAEFNSYGKPLELSGDARLCWQTNGMGSAWWTAAATVAETNRIRATWLPAYDTGATVVYAFLGQTGSNYRAAFTLRYRPGPGATPNALPLPTPTIDCATVTFLHPEAAPFGGGGSGCDTNAVSGIITNHVESGYLCTVAAAQGMTNDDTIVRGARMGEQNAWNARVRFSLESAQSKLAEEDDSGHVISSYYAPKSDIVSATNDPTLVRYSGGLLKHGGTEVTASDVGALSTEWANDSGSFFSGRADSATRAENADTANTATSATTATKIAVGGGSQAEIGIESTGNAKPTFKHNNGNEEYIALLSDIPTAEIAALATTQATHTATLATQSSQLTQLSQSIDYSTNNAALVSTITNLAPTKARGISLADPVRHCNWYQAVTNGVFFWNVEE